MQKASQPGSSSWRYWPGFRLRGFFMPPLSDCMVRLYHTFTDDVNSFVELDTFGAVILRSALKKL